MLKQLSTVFLVIAAATLPHSSSASTVPVAIEGAPVDSSLVDLHLFDGELFLSEGNEGAALKQFQTAHHLDPNRAKPRELLARTLTVILMQGRAGEPGPMGRDAMRHWLWLMENQEDDREAKAKLKELASFYGGNTGDLLRSKAAKRAWDRAMEAMSEERYEDAVKAYREVIAVEPEALGVSGHLGHALLMTEDYVNAEDAFRGAVEVNPYDFPAVSGLGKALEKQGREAEALEEYKRAIRSQFREAPVAESVVQLMGDNPPQALSPEDASILGQAYLILHDTEKGFPYLESAAQREPTPEHQRAYGTALYFSSRYEEAIQALQAAYNELGDLETTYYLGACYIEVGDDEKAARYLQEVLSRDPGNPNALRLLGLQLAKQPGLEREAIGTLKRAVSVGARIPDLACLVGMLESRMGNEGEARRQFDLCLETNPSYPPAHLTLGLFADERGDHGQTILHFEQYLNVTEPDLGILMRLGMAYLRVDRREEGLATLKKIVELNPAVTTNEEPTSEQALLEMASFFAGSVHRYDDAIWLGEELLTMDADNAIYNNNLAMVYADSERETQRAYELAVKANELSPENPGHMDTLAWTLARLERYQEAEEILLRAIDLATEAGAVNLSEVYYHLGYVYREMGDEEQSKEWLTKALEDPGSPFLREAIEALLQD